MNKKLLIIILIIIAIVIVTIIIIRKKEKEPEAIIDPKLLEITYELNAGIPFRWEYEISDPTIVDFVRDYVVKDYNTGTLVGAPVIRSYVFKGLQKGETTILFKLVNFADNYVSKEEKYSIIVDEDLNIQHNKIEG